MRRAGVVGHDDLGALAGRVSLACLGAEGQHDLPFALLLEVDSSPGAGRGLALGPDDPVELERDRAVARDRHGELALLLELLPGGLGDVDLDVSPAAVHIAVAPEVCGGARLAARSPR